MKPIVRNILAVFAGLLVGFSTIMLMEMFGMVNEPPVPNPYTRELPQDIPITDLLIVELGYVFASFGGGATAARLGVGSPMWLAVITGGILMLGGIANLVMLPHPVWFAVLSTLTYVPVAMLGARLVGPRSQE